MKTTLISSLLVSSMSLTPIGSMTEKDDTSVAKNIAKIPVSMEYIESLYENLDPVQACIQYVIDKEQEEQERETFLREREIRLAEEAKLELARRESVTFNPYDVTHRSYVTEEELKEVLRNVNGGEGLLPYASYFIEAEELYGINAFFITAIAAQESGWGQKAAGNGTNLTGYAVYTRNHSGKTFAGGVRENILATAELIANEYVNPEGRYYTKWDNYSGRSIFEINQRYCLLQDQKTVDNRWSKAINKIGKKFNEAYHQIVKMEL